MTQRKKAFDLKLLEKLLMLVKKHKLSELEIAEGEVKYRIKSSIGLGSQSGPAIGIGGLGLANRGIEAPPPLSESPKKLNSSEEDRYIKVQSPFVGTFYKAPSPEADPYVSEGQMIKKGDILCIVEAMKLMNEIESEVSGKVISILAENGQPIEYGEPLFLIDPV